MRFHIISIFPDIMKPFVEEGILGRAKNLKKIMKVDFYNPRDFTRDRHKTVDDRPFGGGPGMVLMAAPILKACNAAMGNPKPETPNPKKKMKIIILSPRGKLFDDKMAKQLSKNYTDLVLISGRYEGIDARVKKALKAEEVSVGDYTLSGGELAALVVLDAVSRKVPGVLGNTESLEESRVSSGEMYTRPEILEWKGKKYRVPKVLLSGNHAKIEEWRKKKRK